MQSVYFDLSQTYSPQTEISKDSEEDLEIPLPINLQGKYLRSTFHEKRNYGRSLIGKMHETWNRTVAGLPFTPKISTLTHLGISLTYLGISCTTVGELLHSTISSSTKGSVPPVWVDLTCSGLALYSLGIIAYRCFQIGTFSEDFYKKIGEYCEWLKQNPYFLEMWEEINREEKLTFKVISKKEAEKAKAYCSDAWYSSNKHIITLVKESEPLDFLKLLIFECCNAFQRQRLIQSFSQISWDNIPNRNTYGIFIEQVEHHSAITYYKVVNYGIEKLGWNHRLLAYHDPENETVISFEKSYPALNKLSKGKKVSHTEAYRLDWDHFYAPSFFLKHSEELEKHPELLNYRSSTDSSLLDIIIVLDCKKHLLFGSAKTQEEVMIALNAFILRWFALKKKGNIHNNAEKLPDSYNLFFGCFNLISALQKKDQTESFLAKVDLSIFEKVKEDPTFHIELKNVSTTVLTHFVSFLKLIDQIMREEHRLIPHENSITSEIEEFPLIEEDSPIQMLQILNSLTMIIQKQIQERKIDEKNL